MTTPPPERYPQDDGPNVHQALVAAVLLLEDLRGYLRRRDGDPADLDLRADALAAVLGRLRDALEGQEP